MYLFRSVFAWSILLSMHISDSEESFSLEKAILWTECYKHLNNAFEVFTSPDANCWIGVVVWIICGLLWCFYQLFHSDGTHSLQRIHRWASDVICISSNLFWWRNKLILNGLRVSEFSANFHFWVYCSFNTNKLNHLKCNEVSASRDKSEGQSAEKNKRGPDR